MSEPIKKKSIISAFLCQLLLTIDISNKLFEKMYLKKNLSPIHDVLELAKKENASTLRLCSRFHYPDPSWSAFEFFNKNMIFRLKVVEIIVENR